MCADRAGPAQPSDFGVEQFHRAGPCSIVVREQYPDRVMMSIAGIDVTFEQMRQRSCAAANVLTDLGVGPGDRVALFTGTCPEWIYFWLGAARIGAVSAAVNAANKGDFLLHALRLSQAKVIVTDAERRPRVDEVADAVDTLTSIVVQDDSLTETLNRSDAGPDSPGEGRPWLFVLHVGHHRPVESGRHDMALPVLGGRDRRGGLGTSRGRGAVDGDAAVSPERGAQHPGADAPRCDDGAGRGFSPRRGVGRHTRPRCHRIRRRWRDGVDAAESSRGSGRRTAAAAVHLRRAHRRELLPRHRKALRLSHRHDVRAHRGFPHCGQGVADTGVPGTSGRPNPDFEVRILDEQGNPLPADTVGEIACRPRHPHVMSEGYVGADSRVKPHPEWFRTGDLGRLDCDQNLTYVDRIKDALRRRGENISSVEVERVVTCHPAVAEAAAVGVPSELGEDDVLVVVTLRPGATLDFAELLDFCAARMPYFCVPRFAETVSELPKNVIGRIRKDVLRSKKGAHLLPDCDTATSLAVETGRITDGGYHQQQYVLDGSVGRDAILVDGAAQPMLFRRLRLHAWISLNLCYSGASFTRDGREFTDLREAFDGGNGRLVTVDHEISVDGVNATQRCVALLFTAAGDGATLRATGSYRDQLIYERGGWYFTSRELQWDSLSNGQSLALGVTDSIVVTAVDLVRRIFDDGSGVAVDVEGVQEPVQSHR